MSRYIDANKLKEFYKPYAERKLSVPVDVILLNIDDMPTEDVQEVRHGRWVKKNVPTDFDGEVFNVEHIVCSVCEAAIPLNKTYKRDWYSDYCPSCGAKMDEVTE